MLYALGLLIAKAALALPGLAATADAIFARFPEPQ
jgi:hypothetical protein